MRPTRLIAAAGLAATVGLSAAATLAAVTPARASAPDVVLSPSISAFNAIDTQFTHFTVTVSCPTDPSLAPSDCPVTLALSWRPASRRSFAPQGPMRALTAQTFTVAAGQSQTLTMIAPAAKLRDVTARQHVAAIAYATLTDLRTNGKVDQQQSAGTVGAYDNCPGPAYVPFRGGAVDVLGRSPSGKVTHVPVLSGDLGVGEAMQVGARPVSFEVLGVTYHLSAGAQFDRTCWGLSDYHRGQAAPTVFLAAGQVTAAGTPHGAQIWVSIGTPEGSLGSRSQERVAFTVKRNARARVSTIRVAVGRTTQVTPFNTPTRSPCTNGQALSVDRHGHIRRL